MMPPVHRQSLPKSSRLPTAGAAEGWPQFHPHHRRRLRRPSVNFPDPARIAADAPIGFARLCNNWLQHSSWYRCLDLFAGSGALGWRPCRGRHRCGVRRAGPGRRRDWWPNSARLGGTPRLESWKWAHRASCGPPGRPPGVRMGGVRHRVHGSAVWPEALTNTSPCWTRGVGQVRGLVYLERREVGGVPPVPANWEILNRSRRARWVHLARVNARAGDERTGL